MTILYPTGASVQLHISIDALKTSIHVVNLSGGRGVAWKSGWHFARSSQDASRKAAGSSGASRTCAPAVAPAPDPILSAAASVVACATSDTGISPEARGVERFERGFRMWPGIVRPGRRGAAYVRSTHMCTGVRRHVSRHVSEHAWGTLGSPRSSARPESTAVAGGPKVWGPEGCCRRRGS